MSGSNVQHGGQHDADSNAARGGSGAPASLADSAPDSARTGKRAGRNRRGQFTNGNQWSLKHGRWSAAAANALHPEQRETLALLAGREAAILTDLGGASE